MLKNLYGTGAARKHLVSFFKSRQCYSYVKQTLHSSSMRFTNLQGTSGTHAFDHKLSSIYCETIDVTYLILSTSKSHVFVRLDIMLVYSNF